MSSLREKFVSFLQLRGFTKATVRNYLQAMRQFQNWLGKSPIHMTKESARQYLDYLKNVKRLAPRTINIHIYALKRFCDYFLPETGIMEPFMRMHTPKYQPKVISASDVLRMIEAAPNLKVKAIITTLYSSGIRIAECLNLRIPDIDSERMVLHIFGKGQRERYALLSPSTLSLLRQYYRQYRPTDYLFPGRDPNAPLSRRWTQHTIRTTAELAGIKTIVTAHVLRHSFATHLLERGESLLVIQRLLGHANVSTTAMYTQVSSQMLQQVKSPLDQPPAEPSQKDVQDDKEPKRRGRPKGSKNRKRGPGRPKGSKNKPKGPGRPKGSTTKKRGPGRPKSSRNKPRSSERIRRATRGGRK